MKNLTIYHGDKKDSITNIEINRIWHKIGNFEEGPGFYFAMSFDKANIYGSNVYKSSINLDNLYVSRDELSTIKKDVFNILKLLKKIDKNFFNIFIDYGFEIYSNKDVSTLLLNNLYKLNEFSEIRNFQMNLLDHISIENFITAWTSSGKIGNFNKERSIVNIFDLTLPIQKCT